MAHDLICKLIAKMTETKGQKRGDNLFVMAGLDVRVEQLSAQEVRNMMTALMERNKAQGQLLVAWKRRLKEQNEQLYGLHRQREEQMRVLTSQLLLLEANMRVKEHKIDALLNQRDRTIGQQQERIDSLEKQLLLLATRKAAERPDSLPIHQRSLTGDDSLDDSDSAVVIEDGPDSHSPGYKDQDPRNSSVKIVRSLSNVRPRKESVKVIRSISDVVAAARGNRCARDGDASDAAPLRRVNELGESDSDVSDASSEDLPFNKRNFLRGSFERIPILQDCRSPFMNGEGSRDRSPLYVNNHRSVTKPRDVKSKNINKHLQSKCSNTVKTEIK